MEFQNICNEMVAQFLRHPIHCSAVVQFYQCELLQYSFPTSKRLNIFVEVMHSLAVVAYRTVQRPGFGSLCHSVTRESHNAVVMPPPRREALYIAPRCPSVCLSVACLDLPRERKGLGSQELVGCKYITRATCELISRSKGQISRSPG